MDIISHGLWATAAGKTLNLKRPKENRLNVWRVFFWGMFPDLFAFTIPFIWFFFNIFTGQMHFADFPRPEQTEPPWPGNSMLGLASGLYNISHSLIIFALVFAAAYFIFKKRSFELLGWPLHILMDIPTHTYRFFPTPVFWPISGAKFSGISWADPIFLLVDYGALLAVFLYLRRKERKLKLSLRDKAL